MKIIYDATSISYYNDKNGHRAGIFQAALNLYEALCKKNVDIDFYCDFSRYYFLKQIDIFSDKKVLTDNSLISKFLSIILYITRNYKYINYFFTILARFYSKHLSGKIKLDRKKFSNYDLWLSPFTPPSREIENSGIKKYRMLHDVIPIIENGLNKSSKQWYLWYNRVYNTINDKDFYITNSEYTKQDVLKYFPFIKESHIRAVLLGANNTFKPLDKLSPVEGKYIFSLCTLGKRKNLEFGIRNFFTFINKHNITDLKLVLGGSVWSKYEKELNSVLDKYDRSKIVLTGYIDEGDLAKYYSNALCFIYPSLYEGFGLPVLEAMQCGCPVICSNRTSLPEVIGDSGIQINPENDEDMIKAYEKMYFDTDFRGQCIGKGLERSKQFSWEKCAGEILDFIKNTSDV